MDQIKAYVDAMFTSLPNTRAAAEMKQNILENMQDHYEELIAQGKSENEALGTVISQFGNIDEIKKALNEEETPTGIPVEPTIHVEPVAPVTSPEYEDFERIKPYLIAAGVILLVLSPVAYMFGSAVTGWFGKGISDLVGEILFFLFVAAAVGLFVWLHGKESYYRRTLNVPPFSSKYNDAFNTTWERMSRKNFAGTIYTCATILYLFLGFTIHWWHPGWMIFLIATAVVTFHSGSKRY